jgi:gliding motility-associated-like protein
MINNSTGATNYSWDFGDGSNSISISPTHAFPAGAAGVYTVILTATDNNGCQDQDTARITVEEELVYYVPNTFTPDGDEFNQLFQPVFTSGFDPYDFNFTVFNRWGETIFESKDASVGWDGSYMGMMAQEGQYSWRIEFKTNKTDERVLVYGHLNLMK